MLCLCAPWLERRRSQFKGFKYKAGCHRAADQRVTAQTSGLLPVVSRYDCLRALSGGKIIAKFDSFQASRRRGNAKFQRCPAVPVPDLGRVDPVPARDLAALEKEVYRRRSSTPAVGHGGRVAKGLAKEAAFRMCASSKSSMISSPESWFVIITPWPPATSIMRCLYACGFPKRPANRRRRPCRVPPLRRARQRA